MKTSAIIIILLTGILTIYIFYLISIYIKLENRNSLILTKFDEINKQINNKIDLLKKIIDLTNDIVLNDAVTLLIKEVRVNEKIKNDKLVNSIINNKTYSDKKVEKVIKEIETINRKIDYAKEFYNDSLYEYNMLLSTISGKILMKIFKYAIYNNY